MNVRKQRHALKLKHRKGDNQLQLSSSNMTDNDTDSVFITLPVGKAVVNNITQDFETRWLQMMLNVAQRMNLPNDYYNVLVLVIMLCMLAMMTIRFVLKFRRFSIRRNK